jgi:pyruvate/2-oxoacid:ferredoxin oxidoreductase alpha subunit
MSTTVENPTPTAGNGDHSTPRGYRDAVPTWPETSTLDKAGRKLPFTPSAGTEPVFMKGNEAIVHGALLAGARCFFGYPITPASEIAHTAAALFPATGGVFLQAESEVAAINMVYGASATGIRTMTASSSPGMSLKQEGISYSAGSELPMVIVDIMRGGPGLGNIAPEQGDYFQMVKGGGHGCYSLPVLAPNSCQEMCDYTRLAFDIADRYRTPVVILADGLVGQMKEPVYLEEATTEIPDQTSWSVQGTEQTRKNLVCSIFLKNDELEDHITHLANKTKMIAEREVRWEEYKLEDADIVLIGYGIISRILKGVVDRGRKQGLKLGLLRPITLSPFPSEAIRAAVEGKKACMTVELSTGQMVEDVRLAASDLAPMWFYGRAGGNVPSVAEILDEIHAKNGTTAEAK